MQTLGESVEIIVSKHCSGVVGVVVHSGTLLFLAPLPELSGFSVSVRQLGSSVFHSCFMVTILMISVCLGASLTCTDLPVGAPEVCLC